MDIENEARLDAGEQEVTTPESTTVESAQPDAANQEAERANNARMAAARRSGRAEAEKSISNRIAGWGRVNPATGDVIRSVEDVEAYFEAMTRSEDEAKAKREGRSVEAVREERQAMQRGRAAMAQEREKEREDQRAQKEVADFMAENPGVDLSRELQGGFGQFVDELGGDVSLSRAWKAYSPLREKREKAARKESRDERSTGGGAQSNPSRLSAEERRRLEAWNAQFRGKPGMKMTEEEFARRRDAK